MKEFKPTQEMLDAALRVFEAMAWLAVVEPVVEAYQKEILDRNQFWNVETGDVITKGEDMYMASDADFDIYLAECNEARKKVKLHVVDENFCPLLVAKHNVNKAEWELINSVEPLTGITANRLWGEDRDKYIDLTLRLLAPFVRR